MESVKFTYKYGKSKALTMSYDDGVVQDKRLVEIFNKNGLKGTFHINGGCFGKTLHPDRPRLSAEEIREVYASHEISCHGFSHPSLPTLSKMEFIHEILDDKKALEDACGYIVRGMSYPFGTYDERITDTLPQLGINYARTVNSTGALNIPESFLVWNPSCHHNDPRLMTLLDYLKNPTRPLPLLYVWGHSYEFDRDDNWHVIEEFCQAAGGDEDIWYATNIEIFDYVSAMRRCELSSDRTMLYNPSALSLWVNASGSIIECKGGETTPLNR